MTEDNIVQLDIRNAQHRYIIPAVLRTLKASWWELRRAKWFGKKSIMDDGTYRVRLAEYKGDLYFIDRWKP